MIYQSALCADVCCATCYWYYHFSDSSSFGCLRQNDSCSDDPLSVVCPLWLDDFSADLALPGTSIQDPPKAGELASA